jgi:hypothetical protein
MVVVSMRPSTLNVVASYLQPVQIPALRATSRVAMDASRAAFDRRLHEQYPHCFGRLAHGVVEVDESNLWSGLWEHNTPKVLCPALGCKHKHHGKWSGAEAVRSRDFKAFVAAAEKLLPHHLSQVDHASPRRSPLHYAAIHGDLRMARWLLQRGASPNVQAMGDKGVSNSECSTWMPLHHAAANGDVRMCMLLLSAGASIEARTASHVFLRLSSMKQIAAIKAGSRPVDIADSMGHGIVMGFLQSWPHNVPFRLRPPPSLFHLRAAGRNCGNLHQEGHSLDALLNAGFSSEQVLKQRCPCLQEVAWRLRFKRSLGVRDVSWASRKSEELFQKWLASLGVSHSRCSNGITFLGIDTSPDSEALKLVEEMPRAIRLLASVDPPFIARIHGDSRLQRAVITRFGSDLKALEKRLALRIVIQDEQIFSWLSVDALFQCSADSFESFFAQLLTKFHHSTALLQAEVDMARRQAVTAVVLSSMMDKSRDDSATLWEEDSYYHGFDEYTYCDEDECCREYEEFEEHEWHEDYEHCDEDDEHEGFSCQLDTESRFSIRGGRQQGNGLST